MSNLQKHPSILSACAAVFLIANAAWPASVTVDFSKTKQIIDGFGGSSAWTGKYSDAVMDLLYGNTATQLGYTILRLRMDPKASAWADEKSNAAKAKARGATVFATPWSPPESLKTNGSTKKGGIITSKYASFAAWMKSFVTYAGESNIDIMSIENEPDYAEQIDYEGCTWTATNFLDFCKTYAPQIGKPIMMPESYNFKFPLSDPTLDDPNAAKNVSYVGGHLYGVEPKTYTKAINLGKHVWMTEFNQDDDSPSGVMKIAKQVLDCMYNSFSGYVWWWMLDMGNGLVTSSGGTKKKAWAIAQFSKWVRPGYYRVEATYNPQSGVYVVAFKGTQNVIVAVNNSTSSKSQEFTYSNTTVTSVQKYTSSSSKSAANDGTITATNNSFTATLDAQSITSFVSTGTPSQILTFGSEAGRHTVEKARFAAVLSDAVAPYAYLVNGKRWRLQNMNESESPTPGMYIMQGNAHISIGVEKILHGSKK